MGIALGILEVALPLSFVSAKSAGVVAPLMGHTPEQFGLPRASSAATEKNTTLLKKIQNLMKQVENKISIVERWRAANGYAP